MTHPMEIRAKRETLAALRMALDTGDEVEFALQYRRAYQLGTTYREMAKALGMSPEVLKEILQRFFSTE